MAIVSMVWIQMFYVCGRGGYTFLNRHIDEQPWRIVLPSAVCFALLSILQFVYVCVLYVHMTFYCKVVRHDYPEHRDKSCEHLVVLASNKPISLHYHMLYKSAGLTLLLWLSATAIMVARVLLAPDFKVVIDKRPKEKSIIKNCESTVSRPFDIETGSKEKLIFMNSEFSMNRSVHFKRMSV